MYKELLQLEKLPFENVPDPEFFFDQGSYGRALQSICDSIDAGRGLMVVTGPIGSGKTTLSQMVMQRYGDRLNLIWMAEPPQNEIEILTFLARELGIVEIEQSRVFLLDAIRNALLGTDRRYLFILDEAHLMSDEVAGTLKILNNLELMSKKLLQIFLLGQDELIELINRPEMASFKQRIAALEVLGRMERKEIRHYIGYRLNTAGGAPDVFTDEALEAIAIGSGGVPRLINTLCDHALARASARDSRIADIEDVYDAAQGMIDRKEIFQMMLSAKHGAGRGNRASQASLPDSAPDAGQAAAQLAQSTDEPDAGADNRQDPPSSIRRLFESPAEYDGWAPQEDNRKKGLSGPLFHLALSSIVLAASILYFAFNSSSSFDKILQWLSIGG